MKLQGIGLGFMYMFKLHLFSRDMFARKIKLSKSTRHACHLISIYFLLINLLKVTIL